MSYRLRLAIAFVIAVAVLHAQDTAPPQPPTFRTEANYVRVDVYPTLNDAPVGDLRRDEFEVLDNGVPQKIEQFERVQIRAAGPQETRVEPNTPAESRAMLEDPRARVFVLFLDDWNVEVMGSHNIRASLVKMLDEVIGQNDLVGVMRPGMAATDVTFARKTTTIEGFLTRYWWWGSRDQLNPSDDPDKDRFESCYPPHMGPVTCADGTLSNADGVAAEMLGRLREKRTLDSLGDLVAYLRGVREERKAIITISDGWVLYRPDDRPYGLKRPLNCSVPGPPAIGTDPRSGRMTTSTTDSNMVSLYACERDRMRLADIDDADEFRRLQDEANRANASFYTVDPRGLVAFDSPIGPEAPPPPSVDQAILRTRIDSLRTLANATDGLAVVNTNALGPAMNRIVSDLTSYYLLGYYTTTPLDGKFHKITVRVKRPGVQVRARRGYLALSAAEATRVNAVSAAPSPADAKAAAEARAIETLIAPLAGYSRELPLRLQTSASEDRIWVSGELGPAELRDAWRGGGAVDLLLTSKTGETVGSGRATVPAGGRTFEVAIPVPAMGDYTVRVRARAAADGAIPINEVVAVAVSDTASAARFVRRGPSTANREAPAADLRFRRGETLRVEWPGVVAGAEAHLLDRTGKPLAVPVVLGTREADGIAWQTAQLALAPLAPGDYIVELVAGSERRMAAFRVVP